MTPTATPEPNFDLIARPYRLLEYLTLGRTLERTRLHFLPGLLDRHQALIFGDGDGRFLAQLLAANPTLQADAVDISPAMLKLLRTRCSFAETRLQTHQTSALTYTPRQPCDLIVTHFFLDCLTQPELESLLARLTPSLTPGALWLISDFRIPASPMRWIARPFVRLLYLAFRILTGLRTTRLPDHASPLRASGLTRIAHHQLLFGILSTELWQKQ